MWQIIVQHEEHRNGRQAALLLKQCASVCSLPPPLDALLLPSMSSNAARARQNELMEWQRFSTKLWMLMGRYGTGVLNLTHLYHSSVGILDMLEMWLLLMSRYANLSRPCQLHTRQP
jgi:hypothetical protein